jgi:P-type conjugative transfer protein TrbJ
MDRTLTRALCALLALLLLPAALSPPEAEAAIPVFDGANFSQNLLTAVRTAQAILQRIRMIENQIRQIEWMIANVRDLEDPTVADLLPLLAALQRLLGRYRQAAVVTLESLEGWVETVYPATEQPAAGELGREQLQRFATTLETAKAVLMATREIARDLPGEQTLVTGMAGDLLATDGLLEAAQAEGLLTGAAAGQLVLLNQQTALANNLQAVAVAHEISSQARAVSAFTAAVEASRVEVGPYRSFTPLPVIPANYPRSGSSRSAGASTR